MLGNPYAPYYLNQAGNGIGSFEGIRFQRGKGFFGSILKSAALPLLSYLGKHLLRTGVDVAGDVINGEPIKEALKARTKTKVREVACDVARRASVFQQTGRGVKRRRRVQKKVKQSTLPRRKVKRNKPSELSLF